MLHRLIGLSTTLLLAASAIGAWTPLNSGLLSARSMTAHNGSLFAACFPSGVQKSTNGGINWSPTNSGLPATAGNYFVRGIGSNGAWLFVGTESGVYRSNDDGLTWSNCNGSLTASSTVHATRFNTFAGVTMAVFAGTIGNGGGIWRTSTGASWSIGHSGMSSNATVHHLKQVGATLYASTSVGLFKSVDNGLNWTAVTSANYAVHALVESNGNLVINCTFGIRYSTNNGASWNDATGDPASITAGDLMAFDGKVYALSSPSGGCYISMDQGVTWTAFNGGFGPADAISQDELYTDGNTLYCLAILDIYTIDAIGQGTIDARRPSLVLSPNPSSTGCWIDRPTGRTAGTLSLLDAQGRVVQRDRIASYPHRFEHAGAPPGLYVITVTSEDGAVTLTGRLLIQ